ncbi:MAG: TRAP transporter small permease [Proteobacteria bacterium]|nr:TRAP transporter small permease [Pseudomonadota bacterium]MBU4295479.1 TRAP transporter small permease [Pseudomonadota bacterium]MCG2747666.1 TRAP transporter small permease [Desulfobulbaceae bacterium]
MNALGRWVAGLRLFGQRLEETFLCLLLLSMILLACLQIALRDLFSGGLLWVDPLLRYLVLWSGMFGAAVATRIGKHIALDVVSYLVPANMKTWLQLLIHLFSTLVSAALTWAAIIFVRNEAEFGGTSLLSIPSWAWNLVFPLAFALITFRFFSAGVADFLAIAGKTSSRPT